MSTSTDLAGKLREVWAEVFEFDDIVATDNFIELGGHSLMAVQIIARIRDLFGVELPFLVLYETANLDALADIVAGALAQQKDDEDDLRAGPRTAATGTGERASILQEVMYLAAEAGSVPFTLTSAAFRISGFFDTERAVKAAQLVIDAHEALRTGFVRDGDTVRRGVVAHAELVAEVSEDDSELDDASWVQQRLTPFDRAEPPLLRLALRRCEDGSTVVAFVLDHIVTDGWSMRLIFQQFSAAYSALENDPAFRLPPQTVTFGDWAAWQREHLTEARRATMATRWGLILATDPEFLNCPQPGYDAPDTPSVGAHLNFTIEPSLTSGLRAFSQAVGVTMYSTVLAALARSVRTLTGADRFLVQTSTANRVHTAHEQIVGPLFHHLHLVLDLTSSAKLADTAQRVQRALAEATELGEAPHPLIRQAVWPDLASRPRTMPIFYYMLNRPWTDSLRIPGLEIAALEVDELYAPPGTETWVLDHGDWLRGTFRWEDPRLDRSVPPALMASFEAELATTRRGR